MNIYWFGAFIIWSIALLASGYEARGWKDEASQTKLQEVAATDLGKGESKIIQDNQNLNKELNNDKDPCLYDKLPPGIK